MTILFENVSVGRSGDFVDVTFDLEVSSSGASVPVEVPVLVGTVDDQLAGGGVPVDLVLALPLAFRLDTTAGMAAERFFQTYSGMPPVLHFAVGASGGTGFGAGLGFLEVSVTPSFTFDIDIQAALNDPDSDGRITLDEWTSTAREDLFTVGYVCADADDVAATLELTSSLLPGTSEITLSDTCLADGLDNLDYSGLSSDVMNFSNVSPTLVLQGLGVLASAVRGSQLAGDLPLPFIQQSLGEVFSFAQPLVDFIDEMAAAAIACGPIPEDPPRGDLQSLETGDTFYCQAIAVEQPDAVVWTVVDVVPHVSCVSSAETVGPNPSANAVCIAAADGVPDVTVTLEAGTAAEEVVRRRFLSVQEMVEQLAELAGFEGLVGADGGLTDLVRYDAGTEALTVHLQKTFDPPGRDDLGFDFGDQLQFDTGLAGLGGSAGASVEIDPGTATLDLLFGVILAEDFDPGFSDTDGDADIVTPDRFFVQKNGGHPILSLDDLGATVSLDLRGSVGFVEVGVDPDASSFSIGQVSSDDPILAIDIDTEGADDVGNGLPDAIRFRQLLRQLDRVEPTFNLEMSGSLKAEAKVGDEVLGEGDVSLSWVIDDPASIGLPTVTADQSFTDRLLSKRSLRECSDRCTASGWR